MSCFCACLPFSCKDFLLAAGALLLSVKKDEDFRNIVSFIVVLGVLGVLGVLIVVLC